MMPDPKITSSRDGGSGGFGVAKLHSCGHTAGMGYAASSTWVATPQARHTLAKAGYPVRRAFSGNHCRRWNTGSPGPSAQLRTRPGDDNCGCDATSAQREIRSISSRPDIRHETIEFFAQAGAFARQRARRIEHFLGSGAGFGGAAVDVHDVGGGLLRALRNILDAARDLLRR